MGDVCRYVQFVGPDLMKGVQTKVKKKTLFPKWSPEVRSSHPRTTIPTHCMNEQYYHPFGIVHIYYVVRVYCAYVLHYFIVG